MASITATFPSLTFGQRGVQTRDDFVQTQELGQDTLSGDWATQAGLWKTEANAVRDEVNALNGTATAAAGTATTKATLATDYAEKMALEVETGTYSSKEHAIGDLTLSGGSAKAWAVDASSPDGTTTKSAKTHSEDAAVSAAAALDSENAAAALLDSFDDRYLGAKASAPTLDNDGNPLTSGALYYNTTSDTMFVYDLELTTWISLTFTPTDHGSLSGLADDDHTQYHNDTRGDARYLKLAGGSLTGELLATAGITVGGDIAFTQIDKGTVSTGTVTFTQSDGNVQKLTVGGALTITTTGFPASGIFGDLVLQLVNAGSATVTLPTVNWIKPDGTLTTSFSTYLTAIARPALQTSGVDFMYLFTLDGGTTLYGKLL